MPNDDDSNIEPTRLAQPIKKACNHVKIEFFDGTFDDVDWSDRASNRKSPDMYVRADPKALTTHYGFPPQEAKNYAETYIDTLRRHLKSTELLPHFKVKKEYEECDGVWYLHLFSPLRQVNPYDREKIPELKAQGMRAKEAFSVAHHATNKELGTLIPHEFPDEKKHGEEPRNEKER